MAEQDHNPRVVPGGNFSTFDDALATFDLVGFLLARHETLSLAALDDRVDRACLKVLCMLIATMNRETRTSWAGREYIAEQLGGMSVKTISNYIYQLKCLGYLVSERRATPQANNRVLMHYTLSKLKPQEIEAAIDRAISSIRGDRVSVVQFPSPQEVRPESSRQDRNSVPVRTGTLKTVPAPAGSQVPAPTGTEAESSRQDGHSNSNTTSSTSKPNIEVVSEKPKTKSAPSTKGTRLDSDWKIRDVPEWGRWTTTNFDVRPSVVEKEGERFRDYWIAQPGAKGVKLDWFATWRNWARRAYAGKEKDGFADAALLQADAEDESEHDRQLAIIRQERKARLQDGLD